MSLAALYNVPSNDAELATWTFANAAMHRDINRRIFELNGTRLDEYVLDPLNVTEPAAWAEQHQLMHQAFEAELGIAGFDLSEVDWKDQAALSAWVFNHALSHRQACEILGLG